MPGSNVSSNDPKRGKGSTDIKIFGGSPEPKRSGGRRQKWPGRNNLLLFLIIVTFLFIPPSAAGERASRADANALPVPVLAVEHDEILTLEPLTIDASGSYDPDGVVAAYFFQFEDGTETGWVTTAVTEHTYLKERYYTIRLKVMDDQGEESSYWETYTVSIVDRLPHIDIEPELTVRPGTEVVLEGYRCWDEDGYIINYTWEFEDNTTLYGPNVTHMFEDPGIYNIFLTVLDDDRKTNKSSMRVVVLEKSVSRSQTMRGIVTVAAVGSIGVAVLLFWRRSPVKLARPRKFFSRGTDDIELDEARLVTAHAGSWFARYDETLPGPAVIGLPANAERLIYDLAVLELGKGQVTIPDKIKKASGSAGGKDRLSEHGLGLTTASLALSGADAAGFMNAYWYALRQVGRHEDMGQARYYVPRTREQEVLAVFAAHKLAVRKQVTGGAGFSDEDRKYIDSVIALLGKSWKTAHSFKARPHSDTAQLYLALLLCEKAGKRRYGAGRMPDHDTAADDEEYELLEDLLRMFNGIWAILKFKEYAQYSEESKIYCAMYLFELVGAQRYLGTHQHKINDRVSIKAGQRYQISNN